MKKLFLTFLLSMMLFLNCSNVLYITNLRDFRTSGIEENKIIRIDTLENYDGKVYRILYRN